MVVQLRNVHSQHEGAESENVVDSTCALLEDQIAYNYWKIRETKASIRVDVPHVNLELGGALLYGRDEVETFIEESLIILRFSEYDDNQRDYRNHVQ